MLIVLLVVSGCWLVGDFAYSRVIDARHRKWERTATYNGDGLRAGYAPYTVGQGPVALLFIHGFGSSPAVFDRMAPRLAERGFTCRVLRLPGFGEPLDRYAAVTRAQWRQTVETEARQLRATHRAVWLVGHSMGGTLAWDTAQRHPELCDGLVLLAPLVEVSSRRSLALSPRRLFRVGDALLPFSDVFETCFPMDAHDPAVGELEARDRFIPRSVYQEMFALLDEARAAAPVARVPLLVSVAPQDLVVDSRAAEKFFGRAHAPALKIIHAERSGHVIPLDYGWEEQAGAAADFIAAWPGPPVVAAPP